MTWNGGTLNGERILIALGGNAMTAPDGSAAPDAQAAAIEAAMDPVADLVAAGARVALTHGNGPQVGNLLIKNQLAAGVVPPVPLDWCGAQTQATVGVMIMNALERALAARGAARPVSTVVTRTLVDASDPGFTAPAKPIGRYFPEEEAHRAMARGEAWKRFGDRGWRRVVASPEPLEILDAPAAAALLDAGHVVVAAGGGGAPVVRADGTLRGVEAVVDKDLAAQLLARRLGATTLVIATDVENAMAGFGTPDARPLHRTTAAELAELAAAGHFAGGSMGPKVEAVRRFVAAGGRRAAIASLPRLGDAAHGKAGTIIEARPGVETDEQSS
ncbi:carbamate kinase [Actinomadura madurae]|uniref:Carbamate kinase n=1 Tax=Actinomadura madurae TaxID=1993 RepID=A0A1I4X854_9ACTN|nr:carbamate kinase [Actinomadura madurae]SFN22158.1 carbamate kinase [Actinomadura madurae]SPT63368.1 Carbamate kinase 2 [Actinomadura madurae]